MLEGVLPVRQLRLGLLRRLTGADQRIGQVVGCIITDLPLCGGHRLGEIPGSFLVVPGLVGGGSGVEPDLLRRGPFLKAVLEVLQRPLVVPLPVIGETRCRRTPDGTAAKECKDEERRCTPEPAPLAQQGPDGQADQRGGDGPSVALDRLARTERPALLLLHRDDSLLIDRLRRILAVGLVKAARLLGNLRQSGGIELRGDGPSALITHEIIPAVLGAHRNE